MHIHLHSEDNFNYKSLNGTLRVFFFICLPYAQGLKRNFHILSLPTYLSFLKCFSRE